MPTNPLLLDLTGSQLLGALLASRPPKHAVDETNQKRLESEHDGMTITRSAVEQVCAALQSLGWVRPTFSSEG